MQLASSPYASDYDPFTVEAMTNMFVADGELREAAAVAYLERYDIWAITRFDEIQSATRDWETFSSTSRPFDEPQSFKPSIPLTLDPPDHTRVRAVINRAISPPTLRRMRATFDGFADELLDRLLADGPVELDAVNDVAVGYALKAFPDILGLPREGREKLLSFGDAVFNVTGPHNEIWHQKMRSGAPALAWVEENTRRSSQKPGGLGMQMFEAADAGEISEEEAEQLVKALLAAGFDTTIASIAGTIRAFSQNPDQWLLLREDRGLVQKAFEEAMRFQSPSRYGGRIAVRDVDVAGTTIPAGSPVLLFWLAGNRDPRHWSEPDRFDILRGEGSHLALGYGIHTCVGQALARIEGQAVLQSLVDRVAAIEPTGAAVPAINMQACGLESVPVRLIPE